MTPLCVDLDGTLILSDTLVETGLDLFRRSPVSLLSFPLWAVRGRAHLKHEIAARVWLEPSTLPYNASVLELVKNEKAKGRKVVLVTAADRKYADAIAQHLGFFDEVLASDGETNLKGRTKAKLLVERFGEKGFSYVGDSWADLAVWKEAKEAYLVNPSGALENSARAVGNVVQVFKSNRPGLKTFLKALRAHQWAKNALIFVPLFAAHKALVPGYFIHTVIAFTAFSLAASGVYVLNDLMDLPSDRLHHSKKNRPMASGAFPLPLGCLLVPVLLFVSLALGASVSWPFFWVLVLYLLLTTLYSFGLKRVALLDVSFLAALYTLRLFAGSQATQIPLSNWLLAFSLFLFLSLALVKRVAELKSLKDSTDLRRVGREYDAQDLQILAQMGVSSGQLSVLVFALYVSGPEVSRFYSHPARLWLLCPLLFFWLSRIWIKTHRGQMHDDPVVFALKDRPSYVLMFFGLIIFIWASLR